MIVIMYIVVYMYNCMLYATAGRVWFLVCRFISFYSVFLYEIIFICCTISSRAFCFFMLCFCRYLVSL